MNDTLEFPEIVEAPRTDVAVAAAGAIDLAKIDLTDVALAQFGKWRPAAAKLKADNEKLVLDLSSQSKIDEAISLRQRTINQPKADANKVAAALKSKFAQTSKSVGAEVEALHKAYDEAAQPLTAQITAAQQKLDDEKEAKRKAEADRLQGLRDTVDTIMAGWLARCKVDGITAERITAGIGMFANLAMPVEVADVKAHWATAYADTAGSMIALRDAANGREVAAALEVQRVENARLTAESERLQAELAAARAAVSAATMDAPQAGPAGDGSQKPDGDGADCPARTGNELMGGVGASLNGWPGNQGTPASCSREKPEEYRENSGAYDGGERPATITQDAQESGSLPGTPGACASTGAEAAEAPGSGDEGTAAHAEERAAEPADAADNRPPINVGEINRRLGFTVTSAFVKDTLGITPAAFSRGGTAIWSASAWPHICRALVKHVQACATD